MVLNDGCRPCLIAYTSLLRLALPSSSAEGAETTSINPLSRVPSVAGASLRRVSSRATLPERGERMLERITPHRAEQEGDDDEGETEGDRREREQQEEMNREHLESPQFVLGEEVTSVVQSTPTHTGVGQEDAVQSTSSQRKSIEGSGWKRVD